MLSGLTMECCLNVTSLDRAWQKTQYLCIAKTDSAAFRIRICYGTQNAIVLIGTHKVRTIAYSAKLWLLKVSSGTPRRALAAIADALCVALLASTTSWLGPVSMGILKAYEWAWDVARCDCEFCTMKRHRMYAGLFEVRSIALHKEDTRQACHSTHSETTGWIHCVCWSSDLVHNANWTNSIPTRHKSHSRCEWKPKKNWLLRIETGKLGGGQRGARLS